MRHLFKTLIYIILGCIAAYYLFKYVFPVFTPFIIAIFLSLLIEPLVGFLQRRWQFPRALAVGVSMLALFGGLGLLISLVVGRLIVELLHLSTFLPEYFTNIKTVVVSLQNRAEAYYFTLPPDVLDFVNSRIADSAYSLDAILNKVRLITGSLLDFLLRMVASVPAWIILIIISGIATYFMAKDRREIIIFWLKVTPPPWGRKMLDITRDIFQAIMSYVRAQMVLISITLVQSVIGLYIIEAPYALLIGLLIGVADLIPVLGPSSIYLPWIAWEFITGDTAFAVKLTILFSIVLIVRQILETKIIAQSMGLHPLATMAAMYVGLQLLGPMGVIAGPLFIITLKAFASAGLIGWHEEK